MCPWYVRRVPSCQTQALTHPLLSEITRAPANRLFDTSCFNGTYVTGDVDDKYFAKIQAERTDAAQASRNAKFLGTVEVANVGADELATDGTPDPSCPFSARCMKMYANRRQRRGPDEHAARLWVTEARAICAVEMHRDDLLSSCTHCDFTQLSAQPSTRLASRDKAPLQSQHQRESEGGLVAVEAGQRQEAYCPPSRLPSKPGPAG